MKRRPRLGDCEEDEGLERDLDDAVEEGARYSSTSLLRFDLVREDAEGLEDLGMRGDGDAWEDVDARAFF